MVRKIEPNSDALTQATVTVTWVIILNKPFYPLYIWGLLGSGYSISNLALLALPFFVVILIVAKKHSLAPRLALPIIGAFDTIFETMVFGSRSGTMLFFAPCLTLAALSYYPNERRLQQFTVALVFVLFVMLWWLNPAPIYPWTLSELETLLNINVLAVASLMALIGLRFAGIDRNAA